MPRWRVDIIRKRAEHLGTVEAANEKEAIEKAAERFDIPPERHNRVAVQKSARIKDLRARLTRPAPSRSA